MARKKQFRLSILIPTLPARINTLKVVLDNLREQIKATKNEEHVEILAIMDCKTLSVGEKRNKLVEMASGDYVVFVDDDDNVPPYYVYKILQALQTNPDCVGLSGVIKFEDGTRDTVFVHSRKYVGDNRINDKTIGRPINHLNPIKRSIALDVKFPDLNYEEDKKWSVRLAEKLTSEVYIDNVMYYYFAFGSKSQSNPDCTLSHL